MTADEISPWTPGEAYHVRTVSHEFKALLRAVHPHELEFSDCEWVPESGRLFDCLSLGHPEPEVIEGTFIVCRTAVQFARVITRTQV